MSRSYDAIVVGARCAGSPTAMALARKGYRVLLVDKATFPSDTVSTHVVHPRGVAALSRWGLLEAVAASGCPPIHTCAFDFGPFALAGAPGMPPWPVSYCPRRILLDKLLLDAAASVGAEIREGFTVQSLVIEDGRVVGIRGHSREGGAADERARVVIGADGRYSLVARAVGAAPYHDKPPLLASYYAYWSGLPMQGRFETYIRERRGFAAVPTNDQLTLVIAGWPHAELAANKDDIEGNYLRTLSLAPAFAARLQAARRESRFAGAAVANYFRKPYGPGWALVGDAGCNKDPITAQGISDAFLDAERCAAALDDVLSRGRDFEVAMAAYQRDRDERVLPMYDYTCQLATLEPPPPALQRLLRAIHGNRRFMDDFARMNAGTLSPAEFFAPPHVEAMLDEAAAREPIEAAADRPIVVQPPADRLCGQFEPG